MWDVACQHSPWLDRNIGWANVPVAYSKPGSALVVDSPSGDRNAVVVDAQWFRPQTRIPDEMKA